jgi:hypothetical protein
MIESLEFTRTLAAYQKSGQNGHCLPRALRSLQGYEPPVTINNDLATLERGSEKSSEWLSYRLEPIATPKSIAARGYDDLLQGLLQPLTAVSNK